MFRLLAAGFRSPVQPPISARNRAAQSRATQKASSVSQNPLSALLISPVSGIRNPKLFLQGIIQRALQLELLDLLEKRRVVSRVDDLLILQKFHEPALRDHFLDRGVIPQGNDFGML